MIVTQGEKPPIGVEPEEIWQERWLQERIAELAAAIGRRAGTQHPIPSCWGDELARHTKALRELTDPNRPVREKERTQK